MAEDLTLPPEWAPHAALWVGWPHLPEEWGGALDKARAEIAGFVETVSPHVPVRIAIGSDAAATAAEAHGLDKLADLVQVPTGDIWLRDTGPIVVYEDGRRVARTFAFNGWGGKFEMPGDKETAVAIAEAELIPHTCDAFVLEGGSIEGDGLGDLLTTRECLLNPNRNPSLGQIDIEKRLRERLGVARIHWLPQGLAHDHTDGHIDNAARYVGPGHILCQDPFGTDDPQAERLQQIKTRCEAIGVDLSTIPAPGRVLGPDGVPLPASHLNFVITNGIVVMPGFGTPSQSAAREGLEAVFPDRRVVVLPSSFLLHGGGSFHCMTCPIPASKDT